MDRIRVLEQSLWPKVPADVIEEAKRAAETEPSWIAMQGMATWLRWPRPAVRTPLLETWSTLPRSVRRGRARAFSRGQPGIDRSHRQRQLGNTVDHHVGIAQLDSSVLT
jgi:hypothetical protein